MANHHPGRDQGGSPQAESAAGRSRAMMPWLLDIIAILVIGGFAISMMGGMNADRTAEPMTERTRTTGSGPAFPAPAVRDRGTGTAPPEANKPTLVPDPSARNVR